MLLFPNAIRLAFETSANGEPIDLGYRVRAELVEGLTLRVRPIAEEDGEEGEGVTAEETVEKEGAR